MYFSSPAWLVHEMITLLEHFRRIFEPGPLAPFLFAPLARQLQSEVPSNCALNVVTRETPSSCPRRSPLVADGRAGRRRRPPRVHRRG